MRILLFIIPSVLLFSCKKYLEVAQPRTQLSSAAVFQSDATATAAQLAIYSQMESAGILYHVTAYSGLSADELRSHSSQVAHADFADNNLTADNQLVLVTWTNLYKYIYQANAVLEGVSASATLTPAVRTQLIGEARFIRALCHYYLVNLFGDVPLVTSTDYVANSLLSRSPENSVYAFMIEDLDSARNLLPAAYKSGTNGSTTERVRPNKWAACALLARLYLHQGKYALAEQVATEVISAGSYSLVPDLNNSFLKGSPEAIFQFMAVVPKFNSYFGANFVLVAAPNSHSIRPDFMTSFRANDKRLQAWTKSISTPTGIFFFPYKYKVGQNASSVTEYTMVLRLGEQYLIRAEARAMQDKLAEGEADLSTIRQRAGLSPVSMLSRPALLDSILLERKYEMMFENGDRWISLKRTGTANSVLGPLKGANWNPSDQLYPIPQMERLRNPNLSQNPGY